MKTQKLDTLDVSKDVLTRLTVLIARTDSGSTEDIRSPMFKSVTDENLTQGWSSIVESSDLFTPMLFDIEQSNLSKFGPRSIAKPWREREEATFAYWKESDSKRELSFDGGTRAQLRPLSNKTVIDKHIKSSTNSGLPDYTRKSLVKDKYLDSHYLRNEWDKNYPAVLFTRTQEAGKTRAVWGIDIATVVFEQMFFQPFLGLERNMPARVALLGPDATDLAVSQLFRRAKQSGRNIVGVDFSAYDQSLSTDLIGRAFEFIGEHYDSNYIDDIRAIADRFTSVPLVTPSGIVTGYHGVPSGSSFTNTIDSLAQYIASGRDLSEYSTDPEVLIQGDDGLFIEEDPDSLIKRFELSGLQVNSEKSLTSSEEVVYLQRYYHPTYINPDGEMVGVYSTFRALNRIVHLEMWTDLDKLGIPGKDFFAIRTISILENCKHHPLFEQFVKYIAKFDSNNLEFNQSSVSKYVEGLKHRAGGLINQYSDTIEGINSFETIKILRA